MEQLYLVLTSDIPLFVSVFPRSLDVPILHDFDTVALSFSLFSLIPFFFFLLIGYQSCLMVGDV